MRAIISHNIHRTPIERSILKTSSGGLSKDRGPPSRRRLAAPQGSAAPTCQRWTRFRYPTIAVYANVGRSTEGTTVARASVLLVGLDPDIVDYTKSPVPGLTAAKVRAAVETDSAKLETLGYSVRSLYVDDGKTQERCLRTCSPPVHTIAS